ncbi:unnamed protein product, partial [Polarella glacialis]
FSCSLTYIVGNSSCSSDAGVVEVAVTKVSGGFNLDLDLGDGNITITPEHRTSVCTTLSGTLGMTLSQLTRCEVVLQSVPGGRRLDDGQEEDFEVESFPRRLATVNASIDYEVVVAHTKAASDAARALTQMARPDSGVALAFRSTLAVQGIRTQGVSISKAPVAVEDYISSAVLATMP